jgi:hypothetical protein
MAHSRRQGDNTGMARDTIKARLRLDLQLILLALDGTRHRLNLSGNSRPEPGGRRS